MLELGCRDPVEQVEVVKANDPHRQRIADLFTTWDHCHGNAPIRAANLAEPVRQIIDPQGRGRQFVVAALLKLANTRAAGFVLMRQEAVGEWGAATYSLCRTKAATADASGHRDHRGHRNDPVPMPPMTPMPEGRTALEQMLEGDADYVSVGWRDRI